MNQINYIIQFSGCVTIFYTLYYFFFRKETFSQLNRIYLLSSLIVSLLIPVMPQFITVSSVPDWAEQTIQNPVFEPASQIIISPSSSSETTFSATSSTVKSSKNRFSAIEVITFIYCLGVTFFFGKLLISLLKIGWQINQSPIERKDGYFLVKSNQPLVCSFFNYIFWNDHLDFSMSEKHQMIQHELAHVKEGHTFDVLFLEVLKVVFWFHPMVYFYKKSLKTVHEYIADHYVFYDLNYKSNYAQLLIKEAIQHQPSPMVNTFFNSLTKNRLIMLNRTTDPRRKVKLLAIFPVLSMLIIAFGIQIEAVAQINEDFNDRINEIIESLDEPVAEIIKEEEATSQTIDKEEEKGVLEIEQFQLVKPTVVSKDTSKPAVNQSVQYLDFKQKVDPKLIAQIEAKGNPWFQPRPKKVLPIVIEEESRDPLLFNKDGSTKTLDQIIAAKVAAARAKGKDVTKENAVVSTMKHIDEHFDAVAGILDHVEFFFTGGMRFEWNGIQNGQVNLSKNENQRFKLYDYKHKQYVTVENFSVSFEKDGKIHEFENLTVPGGNNMFPAHIFKKINETPSGTIVHLFDFKYQVDGVYHLYREYQSFEVN